jgi:hypothetical protein
MPMLRLYVSFAVAAVGLAGCHAPYAMHLPDAPMAREVYPDRDAYRRFRADAGSGAAVTICEIDGVGLVPTFA